MYQVLWISDEVGGEYLVGEWDSEEEARFYADDFRQRFGVKTVVRSK